MLENLTQKQIVGIVGVLLALSVVAGFIFYSLGKQAAQEVVIEVEEEITQDTIFRGTGMIGETEESTEKVAANQEEPQPIVENEISFFVFNTDGTVQQINPQSVVMLGSGVSFADGVPRSLTVQVTPETIFNNYNNPGVVQATGLNGLQLLTIGDTIQVESPTNIRGYNTFTASYISIF